MLRDEDFIAIHVASMIRRNSIPTVFPRSASTRSQRAYIPFDLGPHLCIGAGFATMQMVLTVATVLQQFRLGLAPGQEQVEPEPHIAIRPRGGLHMLPTPRSRA